MFGRGGQNRASLRVLTALGVVASTVTIGIDGGPIGQPANAEIIQPFTSVFNQNVNGGIELVGNALQACLPTASLCAETQAGTVNRGNGQYSMQQIDVDDTVLPAAVSAQTTLNSSMASLNKPAGSDVLYAGLYWSAESSAAARNQIDFLTPIGTGYQTITGTIANAGNLYQGFADVTTLVQAGGDGDYWAGDVRSRTGSNKYAAWSMVVVYSNPSLPVRNLSVYNGFARVRNRTADRIVDIPISGFLTPPFGAVNAEIGAVAYEGDRNISGDRLQIQNSGGAFVDLSNPANPANNFFNSSISDNGIAETDSNPAHVNTMAVDIDQVSTVDMLDNGQTSTTLRATTTGDWIYPGAFTFAVDLFAPEFPNVTKTVADLNGGDALPGDVLEYTVTATNTGNDNAIETVITDTVPANTTFVSGSVTVDGVPQSDAPGAGLGGFDGTQVIARVGTGANSMTGGTLRPTSQVPPGVASGVVRFRVTIEESARGTEIPNQARFDYVAETLGEALFFETNTTLTPVPPAADLAVIKTVSAASVNAGEPVSWTVDVENMGPSDTGDVVLVDSVPGGLTPTNIVPAGCTYAAPSSEITCAVGDLTLGQVFTLTFDTGVPADAADGSTYLNSASVTGRDDDTVPANDADTASVTVGTSADLSITKSDSADPVSPGDPITYTVTVTNAGPSDAQDVLIADAPPGDVSVTNVSAPGATCNQAANSCTVPTVPAGGSATMTVDAVVGSQAVGTQTNGASVSSSTADPTPGNNTTTEDTTITPQADVSVVKTTTDAPVVAGEQVTYQIVVSNAGPAAATATTVSDALDPALTLVTASPSVGSCTGTTTVDCSLGDIPAGGSVTVTVVADVAAGVGGTTLGNSATAGTTTPEPPGGGDPNTGSVSDTVETNSDLRITKVVDTNPLVVGATFSYTITVINDGPSSTISPAVVSDTFPAGLTPPPVPPAGCSTAGQTVTCTIPAGLAPASSASFVLDGSVTGPAAPNVDNTASVALPPGEDDDLSNNMASATSDLVNEVDIVLDKEWGAATVTAGSQTTFNLTVTNAGPSVASTIEITDLLPVGVSLVSFPAAGATCSATTVGPNEQLTCTAPTLAVGATISVDVTVAIDPDVAAGPLSNTASATTVTDDRNPSNNDDTDSIAIERLADLTVTKTALNPVPAPTPPATVVAGGTIDFEVTVSNTGPSSAASTFVGDALPPEMTIESFPAANPACTAPGGVLSCDLGDVAPSGDVTFTYTVRIDASTPPGTAVGNTATATSPTPLVSPPSGSATVTTGNLADVAITKSASQNPATPGGPLTYTLVVSNAGPSDSLDLVVDDPPPAGYTVSAATSTLGTCDTTVSCTIPVLAAGAQATITITGSVDADNTDATLTNAATLAPGPNSPDPNPDPPAVATVDLQPQSRLTVVKTASPTTIDAGGGDVTYTVAIDNSGPSDSSDVSFADVLPADLVLVSATPSQGTCAAPPACELGSIAAGGTATVTVIGYFPSDAAVAATTNTASVSAANLTPDSVLIDDAVVTVTQAADLVVDKIGPVTQTAGTNANYTVSVRNDGPSDATDVTMSDPLDDTLLDSASATFTVSPSGTCSNNAGTIDCDLGDLVVGDLVTITVEVPIRPEAVPADGPILNTASVTSSTVDPTGPNSSTTSTDITLNADLDVVKTGPAAFTAGQPADYVITVTNGGASDATDVVVDDTPPSGMTFGAVSSIPAACAALPCTIPTIAAGGSVDITVSATLDAASNATSVDNVVTVTAATPDLNPSDNTFTLNTPVVTDADVEVTAKTATPATGVPGDTLTYSIDVINNGPSVAENVVVNDPVTPNTTLIPGTFSPGCSDIGAEVECLLGDLGVGQAVTIQFDVLIDADVDTTLTIDNTATASSDTPDGTPGNNTGSVSTPLDGQAAVSVVKSASPDPAVPGETLTYTIVVTNAGPSTARDVLVADDVTGIFDGAVIVTPPASPAGITCDQTVTCDPFDLDVGSATFTIEGTAAEANVDPIGNTATVSSPTDSTPGDNASTISTSVAPSADLTIVKVDDVAPGNTVDPGGAIEYTITVTNDGPSEAKDVSIVDALPAEVTATAISADDPLASCDLGTLTCDGVTLSSGGSIAVTVSGTVDDRAVGTITNSATATSTTPDPAGPNTALVDTDVTPFADVGVTKTLLTSPLVAGLPARYEIVVANDGPATAESVSMTDTLPIGVAFTAISSPIGTCSPDTPVPGQVTCDLGDLGDQASITILVDVLVDPDTSLSLVNRAAVTTTTDQGADAIPDSSTIVSPVVIQPDLRVAKSLISANPAAPDLVAGDPFEYEIVITNDGPSDALGDITLTDPLPSQIEPAAADVTLSNTTDCGYTEATREVSCTFTDDLAVGDSVTITVSGTIQAGASTVDDNTATVSTTDDDPDTGNNSSTATATLVTNADLVATKAFDDATVLAGETTTFTMSVTNNGPSDAVDVELDDVFPIGVSVQSFNVLPATASCTPSGGASERLDCDVAVLPPGATMTVDVTIALAPDFAGGPLSNAAVASSATDDRNPDSNTAVDSIGVEREALLTMSKTANPTTVVAGETVTYTIDVTNAGPSSAEATFVGDALPAGLSFVSFPAFCTESGGILTCDLGEIQPSPTPVTFTYVALVDPAIDDMTDLVNTATASSVTPLPDGAPPATDDSTVTVDTSADVEFVSKSVTPDPVVAGEVVTYEITVRNNGPSIARNVTVDDDLPPLLALVTPLPAGCAAVGDDLSCNVGTLTVAEETTFTFQATVDPAAPPATVLTNDASVGSDEPDPDTTNDTASATTNVTTEAEIAIAKSASPDPAVPGEALTYTITVTNNGPSDAADVVVDDPAPTELTAITATADDGSPCTAAVSCDLGTLTVGETVAITIAATVDPTVVDPIENTATVISSTPEPAVGGTARDAQITTPVAPVADLSIAKAIDPDPPVPGTPVEYTLIVDNPGPSAAQNIVVTDSLDPAITGLATASPGCAVVGQNLTCTYPTLLPGSVTIVVTGLLDEAFTGNLANTASVTTDTPQGADTGPNSATVDVAAVPSADLTLSKTADPDPVIAGERLTYTLTATNDGPSAATTVVIDDAAIPAGFTVDSITSTQGDCTTVPCLIGTLAVGASASVEIDGTVDADVLDLAPNAGTVTSDVADPDPDNNSDSADPVVDTSAGLTTTKTLTVPASGVVVPGTPVEWQIAVANGGPSDARDVIVDDALPGVTNAVVSSPPPSSCVGFPCDLDTVAAGETVMITVAADLPSSFTGPSLDNTATTSSSTFDPDDTDNTSTASSPLASSADLRIEKAGPLDPVVAGTPVAWQLTVTNDGPSDSFDVVITDSLPASIDPGSLSVASLDAACTVAGLDIECTLAQLAAGGSTAVTIDAAVLADFDGADVANAADVTSLATPDPDLANNTATTSSPNAPFAELEVTGSVSPNPVPAGEATTFTFDIVNSGPSNAASTVVTIPIPDDLTIDGDPVLVGAPPGSTVSIVDGQIVVDLGSLPPGTPVSLEFDATVDPERPAGPLTLTATGTTDTDQLDTSNDVADVIVDVITDAELDVVKTADVDVVQLGDVVTFSVAVTNSGSSSALGTTVSDELPEGLTAIAATTSSGTCLVAADGAEVTCTDVAVPPGGTETITIAAEATGHGGVANVATVECPACLDTVVVSAPAPVQIERISDLRITKTSDAGTSVAVGSTVTFTIAVTNDGPHEALGVVASDRLPGGLTFVRASADIGAYDQSTGDWAIGTLADGATATLLITVTADARGDVTNTARVTSDVTDPGTGNDVASATFGVTSGAIPITGSDARAVAGYASWVLLIGGALWLVARRRAVTR